MSSVETGETRTRPESSLSMSEHNLRTIKKPRLEGASGSTQPKPIKERKNKKLGLPEPCSTEDVLWRDVISVLGQDVVDNALEEGLERDSPFKFHDEVDLEVVALSSSGEGLALAPSSPRPWVVIVPFTLPGEKVKARVYRNARLHSFADLVQVADPNLELRDMSRVKCKYFGSCAGCQYQMLSYDKQLDLKRDVVVKAYKNFSRLPNTYIPIIESTIPSPLQYGYRTKLTPHFEAPTKADRARGVPSDGSKPEWLNIGFNRVGTRKVMDIEECPLATPVLNEALGPVRENIIKNILSYKKGSSLLFRDSLDTSVEMIDVDGDVKMTTTPITPINNNDNDITIKTGEKNDATGSIKTVDEAVFSSTSTPTPTPTNAAVTVKHVCVSDYNAPVREQVGPFLFEYTAGSFFQNNNSVLVPLTEYVRDRIFGRSDEASSSSAMTAGGLASSSTTTSAAAAASASASATPTPKTRPLTHLVDAYCGAGLFAISLSPYFETIAGIELSASSIKAASRNARMNRHVRVSGLTPTSTSTSTSTSTTFTSTSATTSTTKPTPLDEKCTFQSGDAADIFSVVQHFPRAETVVIIDPPRKGCDERFVGQLVEFGAGLVVYVSCNVHTQARDVGRILEVEVDVDGGGGGGGEQEGQGEQGEEQKEGKEKDKDAKGRRKRRKYILESLRGIDLFPQTAHVESVAVLRLVEYLVL